MMNNENGRSMVEMLGVLAIIGVLSVAGIAGYSMAMKKYRANEITNVASQAVVLAQTANAGMGITSATKLEDLGMTSASIPGYMGTVSSITVSAPDGNGKYTVTFKQNEPACTEAQNALEGHKIIGIACTGN